MKKISVAMHSLDWWSGQPEQRFRARRNFQMAKQDVEPWREETTKSSHSVHSSIADCANAVLRRAPVDEG